MGLWSRQRQVRHATYVGLGYRPGPAAAPFATRRPIRRRLAGVGAVVAVVLVGAIAAAVTLGGGAPRAASAGGLASVTPSAGSASVPAATPSGPSPTNSPEPAATSEAPAAAPTGYRWPLALGRITTAFAPEAGGLFIVDGQPFHDGIDIASYCGDHVTAAHDGVVIASGRHVEAALGWVGDVAGYEARLTAKNLWGSVAVMVIIDDGNGYRSVYVHLFKSLVKVGQRVQAGELIGWEGRTGDATGCHVHYSIFSPSDPGLFITNPRSVAHSHLPAAEVARIDPMSVLPPLSTTAITWGWGAKPSPSP
jgi:murein DD-endopeptidase MepM/ murein hydrolase activator NlpD